MMSKKGSRKVVGASTNAALVMATAGGRFELCKARQAFEAKWDELKAIAPTELRVVRSNLQKMAMTVVGLLERDSAPERRGVFERYAALGIYDLTLFDRLPQVALAAWYVRRQQQRAIFAASGAVVSNEDVALAYEVRGRMVGVLEHWHGDRHDVAIELAQVRQGSGHQDLANDLDTLAEMYVRDDVRPLIERDVKRYRASDVSEALRLATIIAASLGLVDEGEVERLTELARRTATLLVREYEEHARCGRFFFGKSEDVAVTYPSIFAAVRAPQRKRQGDGPSGEGEPVDEPGPALECRTKDRLNGLAEAAPSAGPGAGRSAPHRSLRADRSRESNDPFAEGSIVPRLGAHQAALYETRRTPGATP